MSCELIRSRVMFYQALFRSLASEAYISLPVFQTFQNIHIKHNLPLVAASRRLVRLGRKLPRNKLFQNVKEHERPESPNMFHFPCKALENLLKKYLTCHVSLPSLRNQKGGFMKKILFTVALLLTMGPLWAHETAHHLTLKIDGMTCDSCVNKVKKQLSGVCHEVHVDLKNGEGMCHYDDPITQEQILSEAQKTGFQVSVKKN